MFVQQTRGLPADLEMLGAQDNAVLVAFDATGGTGVEAPPELAAIFTHILDVKGPLDALTPQSQPIAVSLFELARRHGHAAGVVQLVSPADQDFHLHIFDLTAAFDCLAGVLVPSTGPLGSGATNAEDAVPRYMALRLDVSGVVLAADAATTRALGWTQEQLVGSSILQVVVPEDHARGISFWVETLQSPGGSRRLRQRFVRADGTVAWMEVTETNRLEEDDPHVLVELIDIADEMEAAIALRERQELLARLADALPTGVLQVAQDRSIQFSNRRWFEILGIADVADIDVEAMLAPLNDDHRALLHRVGRHVWSNGDARTVDVVVATPHRGARTCKVTLQRLDTGEARASLLLTLDDVTEQRRLERRLVEQAERDPLTGVLNRSALMQRFDDALAEGAGTVAVLFVDLDRFKDVNDLLGHAAGDALLCDVASAISGNVRPGDLVGRFGGDEFVVVSPHLLDPRNADDLANRIRMAVARLRVGDGHPIAASVGVAVAGVDDERDPEHIVAKADAAMYVEKRARSLL